MPWYPKARQVPLPWYGYPAGESGGNDVKAVVHHIASGWWGTLIDPSFWQTRNGGAGGSVHFAVSLKGQVVQFVDTSDAAYGNGIVLNPSWPPVALGNPNERTVSIEHEGMTGVPWPEAMYQASLELTAWILEMHDLKPTPDTVIGHYRIDSVNRSQCPGSAWPISRMLSELTQEEDELSARYTEEQLKLLDRILIADKPDAPADDPKRIPLAKALIPVGIAARDGGFTTAADNGTDTSTYAKCYRRLRKFFKRGGQPVRAATEPKGNELDEVMYQLAQPEG